MQHRLGAVELLGQAWGDRLASFHMSYDICFRLHVIFTAEVKRYRIPGIRVSVWVRAFVTLCPPPGNQNSPHTMRIKVKVRILKRRTFDLVLILGVNPEEHHVLMPFRPPRLSPANKYVLLDIHPNDRIRFLFARHVHDG